MSSEISDNSNLQAAGSTEPAAVACFEAAPVAGEEPETIARAVGASYRRDGQCRIIVDSCADFAPEVARALGVEIVHFPFVMEDGEHVDDLWRSMSPHEFYERMRAGEHVSTSAVTPGNYLEVFERMAKDGVPAVYVAFPRASTPPVRRLTLSAKRILVMRFMSWTISVPPPRPSS